MTAGTFTHEPVSADVTAAETTSAADWASSMVQAPGTPWVTDCRNFLASMTLRSS